MPKEGSIKFLVNIFEASGEFEISEGGSLAVSGKIRAPENVEKEQVNWLKEPEKPTGVRDLTTQDVYKELRLRGYDYDGLFRGKDKRSMDISLCIPCDQVYHSFLLFPRY